MKVKLLEPIAGFEDVAEFRQVKESEWYLFEPNGAPEQGIEGLGGTYLVLTPAWKWPEWLGGWGFAAKSTGVMFWYEREPEKGYEFWLIRGGTCWGMGNIKALCPTFTPPPITDWTKPVLNPNWKS